jgi:hypothetical protein
VFLSESKDVNDAFARLRPGEWSAKLSREFETSDSALSAEYRIELEALEMDF